MEGSLFCLFILAAAKLCRGHPSCGQQTLLIGGKLYRLRVYAVRERVGIPGFFDVWHRIWVKGAILYAAIFAGDAAVEGMEDGADKGLCRAYNLPQC